MFLWFRNPIEQLNQNTSYFQFQMNKIQSRLHLHLALWHLGHWDWCHKHYKELLHDYSAYEIPDGNKNAWLSESCSESVYETELVYLHISILIHTRAKVQRMKKDEKSVGSVNVKESKMETSKKTKRYVDICLYFLLNSGYNIRNCDIISVPNTEETNSEYLTYWSTQLT